MRDLLTQHAGCTPDGAARYIRHLPAAAWPCTHRCTHRRTGGTVEFCCFGGPVNPLGSPQQPSSQRLPGGHAESVHTPAVLAIHPCWQVQPQMSWLCSIRKPAAIFLPGNQHLPQLQVLQLSFLCHSAFVHHYIKLKDFLSILPLS